jgi:glyoxylase-like metal-dependent hydrolase (beta-lactamase superfamily II)
MLDNPLPKLYASPPADLAFSKVSQVRAFVLERDAGKVLVYAARTMPAEDVGDVSAQYLNHWHELAVGGADAVHAPLVINEADRAAAEDTRPVDRTFSERATVDGDFELIPIPGHTPGATAFLWDSGAHRFLFTGDSLYLRDGRSGLTRSSNVWGAARITEAWPGWRWRRAPPRWRQRPRASGCAASNACVCVCGRS